MTTRPVSSNIAAGKIVACHPNALMLSSIRSPVADRAAAGILASGLYDHRSPVRGHGRPVRCVIADAAYASASDAASSCIAVQSDVSAAISSAPTSRHSA
jgi:hypothetical protein